MEVWKPSFFRGFLGSKGKPYSPLEPSFSVFVRGGWVDVTPKQFMIDTRPKRF